MEKETLLQSFGTFLKRRRYRMRIVPLHQMMGKGKPWNAVPALQVFDALYGDYGVISDWNGYETEQYVDLWHLGIVQFAYAGLHHGVFCEDGKALGSLFSAFFPDASVKPLNPSKPLRVMALRQNEKNDLQDGDSGNLILDIDLAREPESKLKYVCNYLYNHGETGVLADVLEHYGDIYPSPIPEETLVEYWLDKRMRGEDCGGFWKVLQRIMQDPEIQMKYEAEIMRAVDGEELLMALQAGLSLDFRLSADSDLTYRGLLECVDPLAERLLDHFKNIPDEEWNHYDESLWAIASQAAALKKSVSKGGNNA